MKKISCCLLALVVCIGLFVGCGEKENDALVLQPNDTDFGVTAKGVLDALNGQIDSKHPKFDSLEPMHAGKDDVLIHFKSKAENQASLLISSDYNTKQAKFISMDVDADKDYEYYCKAMFSALGFSKDNTKSLLEELEFSDRSSYDQKSAVRNGIQILSQGNNLNVSIGSNRNTSTSSASTDDPTHKVMEGTKTDPAYAELIQKEFSDEFGIVTMNEIAPDANQPNEVNLYVDVSEAEPYRYVKAVEMVAREFESSNYAGVWFSVDTFTASIGIYRSTDGKMTSVFMSINQDETINAAYELEYAKNAFFSDIDADKNYKRELDDILSNYTN